MIKNHHTKYLLLLKMMIALNILLFSVSLILSGKSLKLSINPFTALSPSTGILISLGATGNFAINKYSGQLSHKFTGQTESQPNGTFTRQFISNYWWAVTLISANWLHGSLLHVIFNMIALFQIGSLVSVIYGMHRMFIIYTLSGIIGFYLSCLAGVSVTIGASAAICGLLGSAFYFGRAQKETPGGKAVARMTSGWILSLVIFGFAIPNINNWGHGGGFAAGILLGWLLGYIKVGYAQNIKESRFNATLSFMLMLVTILGLVIPFILLFLF